MEQLMTLVAQDEAVDVVEEQKANGPDAFEELIMSADFEPDFLSVG